MKVALVNTQTGFVENLIVVNSLADPVSENYKLVEIPTFHESGEFSEEDLAVQNILKEIDPNYIPPEPIIFERNIIIGETKWNENDGFYEESANTA